MSAIIVLSIVVYVTGFTKFFYRPKTDPQYLIDERVNIIGTFISEEDPQYSMVFSTNGKCYDYYSGNLAGTYSYSLSNTSPQCGQDILVDESQETSYLSLTDDSNGVPTCYEINGVSSVLSLTQISTQKVMIFNKQ